MKTTDEIRLLLDRFYEGKTTEAEERVLKDYFSSKDIAPELAFERVMFEGLVRSKTTTPNDLEHRLEQQINQWNRLELSTKRSQKVDSGGSSIYDLALCNRNRHLSATTAKRRTAIWRSDQQSSRHLSTP